MSKLSPEEKEPIFVMSEADDLAWIDTYNKRYLHKLDKLVTQYPDICYKVRGYDTGAVRYIISKKWVTIRTPVVLTEEETAARQARGKKMREHI